MAWGNLAAIHEVREISRNHHCARRVERAFSLFLPSYAVLAKQRNSVHLVRVLKCYMQRPDSGGRNE